MRVLEIPASIYKDGRYLEQHPLWHTEHSEWKAAQVINMIHRAGLRPRTVCEVGCGAGEVLRQIQEGVGPDCQLYGFDISPQAIQLCQSRSNARLHYYLIEDECALREHYDLLISVDVIEHVEDWMGHLRRLRLMARYKIFHVPLDLSVQSVFRATGLLDRRDSHGHLHFFTKEIFLRTLVDLGYQVRDVVYTKRSIEIGSGLGQKVINLPRKLGAMIHEGWTARILGGFSLAVLAI